MYVINCIDDGASNCHGSVLTMWESILVNIVRKITSEGCIIIQLLVL
jgi:hypothetical protein